MGSQAKGWSVLQTKLIPPAQRGGTVQRHPLIARALLGAQGRLVLCVAGAGYGKTSLLGQVHDALFQQSGAVGWVSLDESDNDLARFLAHLIEPIRRTDAQFGAGTDSLLRSGVALPPSILRSSLLNEFAALHGDIYIFLDDYHLITDPEVRGTVNELLLAPLAKLHLLVASRSSNELPIGRLRALGHLVEIEARDLAFSEDEATDLLSRSGRYALDRGQVARIHEKTEGWAASLQLASIALRDADDVQRVLDSFSGESRSIGELLSAEVLSRQSAEVQSFLLNTSVLRQFDAGLANAVCEREDSRSLIDSIESQNLFIFSLDDRRSWYRYHHLFQEFLRRQLNDRFPNLVPVLHQRAVAWLTAQGSVPEAIEHAFQAGDITRAAELLDEASTQLFATGRVRTLQRYVDLLPTSLIRQLPLLQLEMSWHEELEWRFDEARDSLESVARLLDALPADGAAGSSTRRLHLVSKLAHRRMMLNALADKLDTMVEDCARWHQQTPSDDPFMRASVGTVVMVARREHYDFQDIPGPAATMRELFLKGGAIYGTVFHDSATATTLFAHGDIEAAVEVLHRARDCAVKLHGHQSLLAAMPIGLLAELAYEQGNTVLARDLLAEHSSFSVESGFVDHAIARFVTASRLAFLDGHPDDADSALDAGLSVAARSGLHRMKVLLLAERARQMVMSGREKFIRDLIETALPSADGRAPLPGPAPTMEEETRATMWARSAAGNGELREAISVIKRWLAFARTRRAGRSVARLTALLASLTARTGDTAAAGRLILECLTYHTRLAFVRTFLDEGPFILPVLEHLRDTLPETQSDVRQRIQKILASHHQGRGASNAAAAQPANAAPVDSLCAREIEIIRLSAQGMRTSDISKSVCLSDSTVKWYWNRIFSKLDVHRRFDAVQVARKQGWIS